MSAISPDQMPLYQQAFNDIPKDKRSTSEPEGTFNGDQEAILILIEKEGLDMLNRVDQRLLENREFILKAIKAIELFNQFKSPQDTQQFLLDAIKANPRMLIFSFDENKNLQFANTDPNHRMLIENENFVLNAIKRNPEALAYLPYTLRKNLRFLWKLHEQNPNVLKECDRIPYKTAKDILLEAIKREDSYFIENYYMGPLMKDEDFYREAKRKYPGQAESLKDLFQMTNRKTLIV